jgi:choline dehydrogenase
VRDIYDYVVVGAGSAGCAVAERLSANGAHSVLLIESGPVDKSAYIHMPRGLGLLLNPGSPYIWEYQVRTGGEGPVERWYRGRTLGGSSSINGMVYMRGAPIDYDGWAAKGCQGWSWKDVAPSFVALEDHDLGPAFLRGAGGPLRITTHPAGDSLCEAILDAGVQMGIARVPDVNDERAVREGGFGYQPSTCWQGRRFSAARAFLEHARQRPNLRIATATEALRIEFADQRATHVVVRTSAGTQRIGARREIVLSGGSIQTPKLLQLSGIGPASLLKPLGIAVVAESPGVGRNLREHRHVDLRLQVRSGSQNRSLSGLRAIWSLARYLLDRRGPMSHSAHEIGGFAKSTPELDHADLQFGLMSLSASSTGKEGEIALDKFPGVTFITYFTRPESQGEVRILSADPDVSPFVDANHLSAALDRQKFIAAFRWNRQLAQQPALKDLVVQEAAPFDQVQTDEQILAQAMQLGGSCFHSSGTARMGTDADAVVDPQLRVRGVDGLRVADTSIMPTLVSGNTNGPAMMIGLRAADFMLAIPA